jgi:hypothetical protein
VFRTSADKYTLEYDKPLKIGVSIMPAEDKDIKWPTYELSRQLQNNYYPTIKSLIDELNAVLIDLKVEIGRQRNSSTKEFTFFSVNDNVVKFTGTSGFSLLLSNSLLKLMHLPSSWLTKSISGSLPVIMKTYKRSHLYVHLDCLDYHYINNNVSDLLKVVPNNADLDGKELLTFSDPQYYAVASRFVGNINMYITDSYFDGILQFDREVAYTLHFRKCLHSS